MTEEEVRDKIEEAMSGVYDKIAELEERLRRQLAEKYHEHYGARVSSHEHDRLSGLPR